MQLSDFTTGQPWAIVPAKLDAMLQQVPDLLTGKIVQQALHFVSNPKKRDDFTLRDEVAITQARLSP